MFMNEEGSVIREALHCLTRFRGKPVILAPGGVGSLTSTDIELVMLDAALMSAAGVPTSMMNGGDRQEIIKKALERRAIKIGLLCTADAIFSWRGDLNSLSVDEADALVKEKQIQGDAKEAMEFAVQACRSGIPRVHFFNARRRNALLEELFTARGAGTMVYSGELYKDFRPARQDDVLKMVQVLRVCQPEFRKEGGLNYLREHLTQFRVFTVDDEPYGCVRMKASGDMLLLEKVACNPRFGETNVIEELLKGALREGKDGGFSKVVIPVSDLPPLMGLLPSFAGLGFVKDKGLELSSGKQRAWVKNLTAISAET